MNQLIFTSLLFTIMPLTADTEKISKPATPAAPVAAWLPDNGDGTFKNPVLFADYSDPDAIRVGDDFWLTASSFNCTPGLPILHSRDLVNWQLVNHALTQVPHPRYAEVQHGCGVWAPAIRFHAGKFWIFFPMPDEGIYVTTATDPAGAWSEPHLLQAGKGLIDPCPFWDDDGQAYLIIAWAHSRSGKKSILTLYRMTPDGKKLLDDGVTVFDGHAHHPTIEGPKLYKRNGYYYIFAPAGGVATGWQTVLRSKNIFGPYEDKIVMDQGTTKINGPHQGAWVDTASGEDWFLHFQDCGALGRVVHLQPMRWINDWPVVGHDADGDGKGEPVATMKKPNVGKTFPVAVPPTSDEFASPKLGLQWQWPANAKTYWFSLTARPGSLRLFAQPQPATNNLWPTANLLLQKFPALEFTAETELDFSALAVGERAGIIVMGMDYSYLAVERAVKGFQLIRASCEDAPTGSHELREEIAECAGKAVTLRVRVRAGALCEFSFREDESGEFTALGEPFAARAGKWIGAKLGLFTSAAASATKCGHADFDFFHILGEH